MASSNNLFFYSVDEVVDAAYLQLDIEDTRDKSIFREFVYDALREIGPSSKDRKEVCLPVENLCFEKPCQAGYLIDLNLMDDNNNVYYYQMRQNGKLSSEIRKNQNNQTAINTDSRGTPYVVVHEEDTRFTISSNGSMITKANMSFMSLPVFDDGTIKVREDQKLACVAYIEYIYLKRERNRTRRMGNAVPMSEVQMAHDRWIGKMQQAKGRGKMPNTEASRQIARNWVTMIANFKDRKKNSRWGYWGSYYGI